MEALGASEAFGTLRPGLPPGPSPTSAWEAVLGTLGTELREKDGGRKLEPPGDCKERVMPRGLNVALFKAFWSPLDGNWGVLR